MKKKSILITINLFFIFFCTANHATNSPSNPKNKINETTNSSKKNLNTSSNFKISTQHLPSISQNHRIKFLIFHYTVTDYPTSIAALTKKNVSAHYLIPDNESNNIDLLVSEEKRAWHAGVSKWKKIVNLNDISIGIEIVNKGFKIINGKKIFVNFTENQYEKIVFLCKNIIEKYGIQPNNILGHSDIAPQRKNDPGPKFPWKRLYQEHKIGAWYDNSDKEYFFNRIEEIKYDSLEIIKMKKEFSKYGYKIDTTGVANQELKNIVTIFQHHFRPEIYDGMIDKETYAILLALNKKYNS